MSSLTSKMGLYCVFWGKKAVIRKINCKSKATLHSRIHLWGNRAPGESQGSGTENQNKSLAGYQRLLCHRPTQTKAGQKLVSRRAHKGAENKYFFIAGEGPAIGRQ
jgi:hypothetical protein